MVIGYLHPGGLGLEMPEAGIREFATLGLGLVSRV